MSSCGIKNEISVGQRKQIGVGKDTEAAVCDA